MGGHNNDEFKLQGRGNDNKNSAVHVFVYTAYILYELARMRMYHYGRSHYVTSDVRFTSNFDGFFPMSSIIHDDSSFPNISVSNLERQRHEPLVIIDGFRAGGFLRFGLYLYDISSYFTCSALLCGHRKVVIAARLASYNWAAL